MKTLNEVIKALEICTSDHGGCEGCPYAPDCKPDKKWDDELHYLKHLQEYYEMSETHDYSRLKPYNPPLTWDELLQMEGKPVWVEILSDEIDLSSRWMMVARETKAHSLPLAYTDDIGHWIYGHEDNLGKTWQAYRKEKYE